LLRAREELLGPVLPDTNLAPHGNAELAAIEDQCIREVIAKQESIGMPVVTDGEFRRRSWNLEFYLSLDGISANRTAGTSEIAWRAADGTEKAGSRLQITGPIRRRLDATTRALSFLAAHTHRTPKVTVPSPAVLHFLAGGDKGVLEGYYVDVEEFWRDVVAAYREELAALVAAGAIYIQVDDVALPLLCDPRYREIAKRWGHDPDELVLGYANRFNDILTGLPEAVTVTLHECRGNRHGDYVGDGGYDPIAEVMFNVINVDGFFLEYDTDRAGNFDPLRFLPRGEKIAVLGLISSKVAALEDPDAIKRRIEQAAKRAPLEQLALSPQCGFASSMEGSPVDEEAQWKKLELVVEVAGDVWTDANLG